MLRVEWQRSLQPLQRVEHGEPDRVESKQRQGVHVPFLLGGQVDPDEPIDAALDRANKNPNTVGLPLNTRIM